MQKGITPIISVILLLLVAISITGFAFIFFGRAAETASQQAETELEHQASAIGERFAIESADRNKVYIRNLGTGELKNLNFYVNDVQVNSNNPAIPPNAIGEVILDDAQLAMLPDPAELRVTSLGYSDRINENFYGKYTIAYWKFDEAGGGTVTDSSGNGNDGTISGSVGWPSGRYGTALDFDAADEFALKDWADFNIADYTIQFWMRADTVSAGWRDMVTIASESGRFHLDQPDNSIVWYDVDGTGSLDSNVVPVAGRWYHVTGTHQGNTIKIYVDGAPKSTKTAGASTGSSQLKVGTEAEIFDGQIDEVRILNVPRSMAVA